MRLSILKSKLHLATITRSDLYYHGSLTIDPALMDACGLVAYEEIMVSNVATGLRATTYAIPGRPGERQVELNGAMARLGAVGDRIIIMAFAQLEPAELQDHRPVVLILDTENKVVERVDYPANANPRKAPSGGLSR